MKTNLETEKQWVYQVLILVAGFYGGYTMQIRGGVFSNAQTGNIALMGLALGNGNWQGALYYLFPLGAYILGALVSEFQPTTLRKLRWSTALILFEILMVAVMGFIPASAPHQICQIIICFICAMQFNTFRGVHGVAQATTFVSNHVRQVGVAVAWLLGKQKTKAQALEHLWVHGSMVLCFLAGVTLAALTCRFMGVRAIWCNLLPLGALFAVLLRGDLTNKELQMAR